MDKLYRIAPLKWMGKVTWEELSITTALTAFGRYSVVRFDDGLRWEYCFEEYYDEGQHECSSVEEGKRLAEQDWFNRLSTCLIEDVAKSGDEAQRVEVSGG